MAGRTNLRVTLTGFGGRVTASVVLLVVSVVTVLTAVTVARDRAQQTRLTEELGRNLVEYLAHSAVYGLFAEDAEVLALPLSAAVQGEDVLWASLSTPEGTVVAGRSRRSSALPPVSSGIREHLSRPNAALHREVYLSEGDPVLEFFAPVVLEHATAQEVDDLGEPRDSAADADVIGFARIGLSTTRLRENVRQSVLLNFGLLFIFSALGFLMSVFISRRVAGPIQELTEGAYRLGAGDLETRIRVKGDDEVGELARSFNQMARDLSRRTLELNRRNAEMESIVYTVSHDLKTPLVSIKWLTDLLQKTGEEQLDRRGRHYLARIRASVDRMENLIRDLLEISRIGHSTKPREDVDIGDLVQEVLILQHQTFLDRGIEVDTAADFPTVECERGRVAQVLENLVGNAAKYMGDEPRPRILIGWEDGASEFEFWIRDNGVGIAREYRSEVFRPFARLDEQTEAGAEGSGLGLTIAKRIVESHGGRIWVEAAPDKGSVFRWTLPRHGPDEVSVVAG